MNQVEVAIVPATEALVDIFGPDTPSVIEISFPGPQGPPGPPGIAYVFTQASVSAVWTINHNLGYRPSVELLDTGSQEIDGEISHPSVNQTVVILNPATAGTARLT